MSFELPDHSYEQFTWELNEHAAASVPPLMETLPSSMMPPQAGGELPLRLRINGYLYMRVVGGREPFAATEPASADEIATWYETWEPRIEELAAQLEQFDPAAVEAGGWRDAIEAQQAQFGRTFAGVHRATVGQAGRASGEFIERYGRHFGQERAVDATALLQGVPNLTSERVGALWNVSRLLRGAPGLAGQLRDGRDPRAVDGDGAGEFGRGLEELLGSFGHTTQDHLEDLPSWSEAPSQIVPFLLTYAGQDDARSPRVAEQQRAERRRELEAELRAAAESADGEGGEGGEAAALLALLPSAQQLVPVTEDHNLLADQRLASASRTRWLRIGEHLRALGALSEPGDVFYLACGELIDLLEGGVRPSDEELAARRAQQVAWRSVAAPSSLGAAEPAASSTGGPAGDSAELNGLEVSAGRYRGRARVAASLDDARGLQQGEVLVCGASTPEWTPLFAVAGAVVTDSGGMLTHCAIVAREYGIPAVVATRWATRDISDGATVTVDGAAGTVTVEQV
ncbi:MAG: PEP-utilizing enzyme [Dehalococcoidia bacterium]|nr:PEP-utilizing enzyme [Dehalococcoidia bacterium]